MNFLLKRKNILLGVVLALSLTGCGNDTTNSPPVENETDNNQQDIIENKQDNQQETENVEGQQDIEKKEENQKEIKKTEVTKQNNIEKDEEQSETENVEGTQSNEKYNQEGTTEIEEQAINKVLKEHPEYKKEELMSVIGYIKNIYNNKNQILVVPNKDGELSDEARILSFKNDKELEKLKEDQKVLVITTKLGGLSHPTQSEALEVIILED
ncbi:hypothetical protein AB6A23_09245 [Paenibacillus tarimensis]